MNPQNNPSQPTQNCYPTLPPAQNAQNPSYSHPSSQGQGQGQYIPPAAHGQIQAGPNQQIDMEKMANMNKLKQLDESLGGCGMTCYKIWLLTVIIFSCMGVYLNFVSFLRERGFLGEYSKAMDLSWFVFSVWSLIRSVLGFIGGYKKNLTTVSIAFWMTIGNLLLIAGGFIAMFLLLVEQNKYMYVGDPTSWIFESVENGEYVIVFGSFDVVYFILEMIGMARLRKILMEREIVKASLDEVNISFNKI